MGAVSSFFGNGAHRIRVCQRERFDAHDSVLATTSNNLSLSYIEGRKRGVRRVAQSQGVKAHLSERSCRNTRGSSKEWKGVRKCLR